MSTSEMQMPHLPTQLKTESTDMKSTTQEIVYSYASMTHKEGPACPFQNIESQNTQSHVQVKIN